MYASNWRPTGAKRSNATSRSGFGAPRPNYAVPRRKLRSRASLPRLIHVALRGRGGGLAPPLAYRTGVHRAHRTLRRTVRRGGGGDPAPHGRAPDVAATRLASPDSPLPIRRRRDGVQAGGMHIVGRCGCDCGCRCMDGEAFHCQGCRRIVLSRCCGGDPGARGTLLCHHCEGTGHCPRAAWSPGCHYYRP